MQQYKMYVLLSGAQTGSIPTTPTLFNLSGIETYK